MLRDKSWFCEVKEFNGASVGVMGLIRALQGASVLSYDPAYGRSVCGEGRYPCPEAQAGVLWSIVSDTGYTGDTWGF